ncbi:hypothetical protein T11_17011 [Trichinella zimbabwensis]|uniref:Uncharacterized protein n=1 Tax=Trichinella zimbabwensis TaxID=268475 RepID=A0A0V1H017_9BILA|nr:hypothetical protein T11_17011 [Trichinella zimbabwensis]
MQRNVGERDLNARYNRETDTKRKVKMPLATAFLPVPQVYKGSCLLEAGTTAKTNNHLEGWHNRLIKKADKSHLRFYELLQLLITEHSAMDTLTGQLRSENATSGNLRRVSSVYSEKHQRVKQYMGEYMSGRRTLGQFLEALMYITPEPI